MKIDASNAYFSVQQTQAKAVNDSPSTLSKQASSPEVAVSTHEQTLIAEGSAKLKALEINRTVDVASIRQQMLNGEINFDMRELANALVNSN